jgi:hypothetical protein
VLFEGWSPALVTDTPPTSLPTTPPHAMHHTRIALLTLGVDSHPHKSLATRQQLSVTDTAPWPHY